jgi:hypothetical protein
MGEGDESSQGRKGDGRETRLVGHCETFGDDFTKDLEVGKRKDGG